MQVRSLPPILVLPPNLCPGGTGIGDPVAVYEGVQQKLEEREVGGGVGSEFPVLLPASPPPAHTRIQPHRLPSLCPAPLPFTVLERVWDPGGPRAQPGSPAPPPLAGSEECHTLLLQGLRFSKSDHTEQCNLTIVMLPRALRSKYLAPTPSRALRYGLTSHHIPVQR